MNIRMDLLAKDRLSQELDEPEESYYNGPLAFEGWSLWLEGRKWSEVTKESFHFHVQFPVALDWWVENGRFGADVLDKIDWTIIEPAMKLLPYGSHRRVSKHASEQCGVGVTLVKWKKQVDPDCPRCGWPETAVHVNKCPAPSADGQWAKSLSSFRSWMESKQTNPALRDAILLRLDQWRHDLPFTPIQASWPGVREAVEAQDLIGWDHFLMGLLSPLWKDVQDSYYRWLGKRNTGRRWAIALITKLFQVSWEMWADRNNIRHAPNNPRYVKAVTVLDQAIEQEMTTGLGLLPQSVWHLFDQPLAELLSCQVGSKKQWLSSVESARRYAKSLHEGTEVETILYREERASLRQWMKTGRY